MWEQGTKAYKNFIRNKNKRKWDFFTSDTSSPIVKIELSYINETILSIQ